MTEMSSLYMKYEIHTHKMDIKGSIKGNVSSPWTEISWIRVNSNYWVLYNRGTDWCTDRLSNIV